MPEKNSEQHNTDLYDAGNIFEEFSDNKELENEVAIEEEKRKKDMYYYIHILNSFLFSSNILFLIVILLGLLYMYFQNRDTSTSYTFPRIVCEQILGTNVESGACRNISSELSRSQEKIQSIKSDQTERIMSLLGDVYAIYSGNSSPKIAFLLSKTNSRLKPSTIIQEFDAMKGQYASVDKTEISCYDITIQQGNIMNVSCDIYSSDWDSRIVVLEDKVKRYADGGGTSVSRASAFMEFIENYSDSNFRILEKPRNLSFETVQSGPYTRKTSISMTLEYVDTNLLNF